jgi:hypothetical protein
MRVSSSRTRSPATPLTAGTAARARRSVSGSSTKPRACALEGGWPATGVLLVVKLDGEELTTSYLGRDSLRAALARGDIQLSSLQQDNDIILTDSTSRLVSRSQFLRHRGLAGTQVWRRLRP